MEPFRKHRGKVAVLMHENIDTDQIIPKQFLKSIKRTGYEAGLFFDWRFLPDGKLNPAFELNQEKFRGASILLVGNNFGCGSSREHAVWAVMQYGFKVVIAPRKSSAGQVIPGFADIFRSNSGKNGLLLVELTEAEVAEFERLVAAEPGIEATVDLQNNVVLGHAAQSERRFSFMMDATTRERLLKGLDDIGLTLLHSARIAEFEKTHDAQVAR